MSKKNKRRKKKNKVANKSRGFYKQIKDASEEYDSLVKEDAEEKVKEENKGEKQEEVLSEGTKNEKANWILYFSICLMLVLIVYVGSLLLGGLTKDYSMRDCEITCGEDKVYQYSDVKLSDFFIKFKASGNSKNLSKLSSSYQCKLLSKSYVSNEVSIRVDNKIFKVKVNLVEAKDVEWSLKGKDKVTRKDIENAKKEDYECVITYKDKTERVIKPDKVSVKNIEDGVSVILDCGGSVFSWEPDLSER